MCIADVIAFLRKSAITIVLVGLTMYWSVPGALAQNATCVGSETGTFSNLVVPDGSSCNLFNATVHGDVFVGHNARLTISAPGMTKIDGDVHADHCASVNLTGSVAVGGNVHIHHCTLASGYLGPGIQIRGNFECHDNSAPCTADGGEIGGDLRIQNNDSSQASDVSLNTIVGNLECRNNVPAPTDNLGPNEVTGNAQDQCSAALGFTIVLLPATTQTIGRSGGTVTTPQGYQLIVPAGALSIETKISLRPVLRNEIQTILETNAFDGQKLTFLGALDVEMSAASFAARVSLSIPNTSNVPANAQILVAQIVAVSGGLVPDVVLVDTASIVGGQIQDGSPALPGVTRPGTYAMFQVNPTVSYQFVSGQVTDAAGAALGNAPVWSSSSPDFYVLSNGAGTFTFAAPTGDQTAVLVAADNDPAYAANLIAIPGFPTLRTNQPPQQIAPILDAEWCSGANDKNLTEAALDAIRGALREQIEQAVKNVLTGGTQHIELMPLQSLVPPPADNTITLANVGQSTIVTPDFAKFFDSLAPESLPTISDVVFENPPFELNSGLNINSVTATNGLANATVTFAAVDLQAQNPSIALVVPAFPNIQQGAMPTFSVQGLALGTTVLFGSLHSITLTIEVQLDVTNKLGAPCPAVITPVNVDVAFPQPLLQAIGTTLNVGVPQTTYVYNGPAFTYTYQGGPPGYGPNITGTATFNADMSNATGWYGTTAGTNLSVPVISNPVSNVQLTSGTYTGSLSSSQNLAGPLFYFQNGVITQWEIYFVSSNSNTNFDFLTENTSIYTEDSLFSPYPIGTSGVGEIFGVGVWSLQ